jgi:hypothetical protein
MFFTMIKSNCPEIRLASILKDPHTEDYYHCHVSFFKASFPYITAGFS